MFKTNRRYSTQGYKTDSPDRFQPFNTINSGRITMQDVPHSVYGMDNKGNGILMHPGGEYRFPGNQVREIPVYQQGALATMDPSKEPGIQVQQAAVNTNPAYQKQDLSYLPLLTNSILTAFSQRVDDQRQKQYQSQNLVNPLNFLTPSNPQGQSARGMEYFEEGGTSTDDDSFSDDDYLWEEEPTETPSPAQQDAPEQVASEDAEIPISQGIWDEDNPMTPPVPQAETRPADSPYVSMSSTANLDSAIIANESSGNYKAKNPYSSAIGKYQFLWGDWGNEIKRFTGLSKEDYVNSPEAQESFYSYYKDKYMLPAAQRLQQYNNKGYTLDQLAKLYHYKGEAGARKWLTQGIDDTSAHNISIDKYIGKK